MNGREVADSATSVYIFQNYPPPSAHLDTVNLKNNLFSTTRQKKTLKISGDLRKLRKHLVYTKNVQKEKIHPC